MPAAAHTLAAFPGAEGFGSAATGGRGGKVVYVEHLADAFASESLYEGSLRKALEGTSGPRTVVFRKGGVIRLKAGIRILPGFGNVTIAGQTAPGGGIGLVRLEGDPVSNTHPNLLSIETSNVIVRHIRLRPGFFGGAHGSCTNCERKATALSIKNGAQQVIVDHVSMSWGNDGSAEIVGGIVGGIPGAPPARVKNVTIQWSIVSEGITLDPVGDPTQGLTSFGLVDQVSLHHNLFAHNQIRNPELTSEGLWELINNVFYDNPNSVTELAETEDAELPLELDYIANYSSQPSDGPPGPSQLRLYKWLDEARAPGLSLFVDSNIGTGRTSDGQAEWQRLVLCRVRLCAGCSMRVCEAPYPRPWLRPAPHAASAPGRKPVTIDFDPAYRELWTQGLREQVGASLPTRDRVDDCVVDHVDRYAGGVIRNLSQGCAVGGFALAGGVPVVDFDGDGIPDAYETQHPTVLDRFDGSDGSKDPDADCYTSLEEYLNGTPPEVRASTARQAPYYYSIATEDGQLNEGAAGAGGAALPLAAQIKIGDDDADRELRALVSFDTSSLPQGATVCQARLTLWPVGPVGAPAGLGAIYVVAPQLRSGGFGGDVSLHASDFQAPSTSQSPLRTLQSSASAWEALLQPATVDPLGRSQFRLQVGGDDGDGSEDGRGFYSSDLGDPARRPTLTVVYQP